jgi:hypothetical protein
MAVTITRPPNVVTPNRVKYGLVVTPGGGGVTLTKAQLLEDLIRQGPLRQLFAGDGHGDWDALGFSVPELSFTATPITGTPLCPLRVLIGSNVISFQVNAAETDTCGWLVEFWFNHSINR